MATHIDVIQKVLDTPGKIIAVYKGSGDEYYFNYAGHIFSVLRRAGGPDVKKYGEYSFYVYPHWTGTLKELDDAFSIDAESVELVDYHSVDSHTEYDATRFGQLHQLLREKHLNIDKVFNDILES